MTDHSSEWLHKMIWDVFESVPSRDETQPTEGVMERFVPALSQAIQAELSELHKLCFVQPVGDFVGCDRKKDHKGYHSWEAEKRGELEARIDENEYWLNNRKKLEEQGLSGGELLVDSLQFKERKAQLTQKGK